jgi:hypothetical protein
MRRSIASLLAVVMLWTGFVLSAGTVSAHSDPNLGNLHVDAVEITEGKTKFGLGSTIKTHIQHGLLRPRQSLCPHQAQKFERHDSNSMGAAKFVRGTEQF